MHGSSPCFKSESMDGLIKLLIDNKDNITFLPSFFYAWSQPSHPCTEPGIDLDKGCDLQICGRNVSAVFWSYGCTTQHVAIHADMLSFEFSGCSMAAYTKQGVRYAVHVGASDPGHYYDDSRIKFARFYNANRNSLTTLRVFKPYAASYLTRQMQVWGAITREGNCYTVIMQDMTDCRNNGREFFKLHAIWQHRVSSDPAFYQRIMSPQWTLLASTPDTYAFVTTRWNKFFESLRDELIFTRVLDP